MEREHRSSSSDESCQELEDLFHGAAAYDITRLSAVSDFIKRPRPPLEEPPFENSPRIKQLLNGIAKMSEKKGADGRSVNG